MSDPKNALDYPHISDEKYIIVWHNNVKWPAANRKSSYLSDKKFHAIDGWALFTPFWEDAVVFDNHDDAKEFVGIHEYRRNQPYDCKIMRVDSFKKEMGYS